MRVLRSKSFRTCAVVAVGAIAAAVQLGSAEQREPPQPVAPPPAQPARLPTANTLAELLTDAGRAPLPPRAGVDVFAARRPKAAPVMAPAPLATKPALPAFPYKYAGWLREGSGSATFFLEQGDRIFPIKSGDVVQGFRIDAIDKTHLDVTFLAGEQHFSIMLAEPASDATVALPATAAFGSTERSAQAASVSTAADVASMPVSPAARAARR